MYFISLTLLPTSINEPFPSIPEDFQFNEAPRLPKNYKHQYLKAEEKKWEPFRLTFDYSTVEEYRCKNVGDRNGWGYCKAGDIDNFEEKMEIAKKTLNNLAAYMGRLLKVVRVPGSESDFVLDVRPCCFEGSTVGMGGGSAPTGPESIRSFNGQMLTSISYIKVTDTPQDIDSVPNNIFKLYFHELAHCLIFSGSLVKQFEDPANPGLALKEKAMHTCEHRNSKGETTGKKFTFVSTPVVKKFIQERFGLGEEFWPGCPVGAEIEDGSFSGVAGFHWKARTFFTENMVGYLFQYSPISNLTLSLFQDSGWYQVDFSMAEPLFWGDSKARIGDKPYKDFPVGAPIHTVWPKGYVLDLNYPNPSQNCLFDHSGYGNVNIGTRNPNGGTQGWYKYPGFYDPNNTGKFGATYEDLVDYAALAIYQEACPTGQSCYKLTGSSDRAKCTKMTCNEKNELFVTDPRNESRIIKCESDEQLLSITDNGFCPDPKIVCGRLNYNLNNHISNPAAKISSTAPGKSSNIGLIVGIVVGVVAVITIIIVITVIVIRKQRSKQGDFESDVIHG